MHRKHEAEFTHAMKADIFTPMAEEQIEVECIVIGAGIVGLSIARSLALSGRDVYVLERENAIGTGISSRNSEVIHAGIYYPKGSLKAQLCVEGKSLLYDYVQRRGIAHNNCGKLIVAANSAQEQTLKHINAKAMENSVSDLRFLTQSDIQDMEPQLDVQAALFSPSTGIIDTHELMTSLQGDLEDAGGACVFLSHIKSIRPNNGALQIELETQGEVMQITARTVVNAAGLNAVDIARNIEGFPLDQCPTMKYAKGNYFSLSGKHSFNHLIYPVPEDGGLGVHLTLDLHGKARFGPDVEWIDAPDYIVNPSRAHHFYAAIRSYWPHLTDGALSPDYAGVRPKIYMNGTAHTDFMIQGADEHGINGLINLFGIESPGLTASLAIAKYVKKTVG